SDLLIQGGRGPGQGEQPMIEAIEGEDGPLQGMLESAGLIEPEAETEATGTLETEREEQQHVQLVRIASFSAQDLPQIVQLRGRTQASATIAARAETSGTVKEVHVSKGQSVAEGDLLCTLDQGT